MASLGSKIKSAAKSVAKNVYSGVNNAAAQIKALGKTQTASAANMTSVKTGKPAVSSTNTANSTAAKSGVPYKPSTSTGTGGMSYAPNMTSAVTRQPTYGATAPSSNSNMTAVSTGLPSRGTTRSSGGGSSQLAGSYGALESMFGGDRGNSDSYASNDAPGVTSGYDNGSLDTYRGMRGISRAETMPGQGMSLEAQAQQPGQIASAAQRQQNIGTIENGAAERQRQVTALQGQLAALQQQKAAQDAMAPGFVDPLDKQLTDAEDNYLQQEEALQREIERMSQPSAEELAAQAQEDELTAKEAAIKAGVQRSTAEISSQPIPYGFVTGQSAAVERRANADLGTIAAQKIPITQRLANEQARRAAALDVVKTTSARAASRTDRATDRRYDYQSETRKNKREDEKTTYDRAQAEKKYNEDVRQFGVTEARLRQNANSSSNSPLSRENLAAGEAKLKASMGPDGYVDPTVYQQAAESWPGTRAEFLSKYPPKAYVNPANTWLPSYLRPTSSEGGA